MIYKIITLLSFVFITWHLRRHFFECIWVKRLFQKVLSDQYNGSDEERAMSSKLIYNAIGSITLTALFWAWYTIFVITYLMS